MGVSTGWCRMASWKATSRITAIRSPPTLPLTVRWSSRSCARHSGFRQTRHVEFASASSRSASPARTTPKAAPPLWAFARCSPDVSANFCRSTPGGDAAKCHPCCRTDQSAGGINRAEPDMPCAFARTTARIYPLILLCLGAARAADTATLSLLLPATAVRDRGWRRRPLKMSDEVRVADTIDVPVDAKLKLRMKDGSILSVASGSQMTITPIQLMPMANVTKPHCRSRKELRSVVSPIDRPTTAEVKTAVGARRALDRLVCRSAAGPDGGGSGGGDCRP